jgi:hypothetical protein
MNSNHPRNRSIAVAALVACACLFMTACDFDHVVVIFGPPSGSDQGPSCGVFCVDNGTVVQSEPPEFDIPKGNTVRFLNATERRVIVTLDYSRPDTTTGWIEEFSIAPGKGKNMKIKKNLADGTTITITYELGGPPGHGGPTMIVQPEESIS